MERSWIGPQYPKIHCPAGSRVIPKEVVPSSMQRENRRTNGWATCGLRAMRWSLCLVMVLFIFSASLWAQTPEADTMPGIAVQPGPDRRLPERGPGFASIQGRVVDQSGAPVAGASVAAHSQATTLSTSTTVEGIFRFRDLPAGQYQIQIEKDGYRGVSLPTLGLNGGDLKILSLQMMVLNPLMEENKVPSGVPGPARLPTLPPYAYAAYPGMRDARPETDATAGPPEVVPAYDANFMAQPDRWSIPMPEWRRYATQPDVPYVKGHWYDPY